MKNCTLYTLYTFQAKEGVPRILDLIANPFIMKQHSERKHQLAGIKTFAKMYTMYTFQAREGVPKALGSSVEDLRYDGREP